MNNNGGVPVVGENKHDRRSIARSIDRSTAAGSVKEMLRIGGRNQCGGALL